MGCGVYWQQVGEVERAMRSLRRLGISEVSDVYKQLYSMRGQLMARVGFKFPRTISAMAKLVGLSPGTVTLWHDVESGWMSEARVKPGAPPIYHYINDEQAVAIINRDLTPKLHTYLFTPDPYQGE